MLTFEVKHGRSRALDIGLTRLYLAKFLVKGTAYKNEDVDDTVETIINVMGPRARIVVYAYRFAMNEI